MLDFLEAAHRQETVVDLRREGLDSDRMGWVVGLGPEWVVLHQISDRIWLDGYMAMRLDDVSQYRDLTEVDEGFVPRAARLRGLRPEPPTGLDAQTTAALVTSLAALEGLVALHFDRREEPYALVGELLSATPEAATLRLLSTAAAWEEPHPEEVALADVTTVTAAAEYERALALVSRHS